MELSHGKRIVGAIVSSPPLQDMPMNKLLRLAAVSTSIALLGACATTPAPTTVAGTIAGSPQLTTLNKLVNDSGLAATLQGPGPYTVFAPTDEAFKAVPAATLASLGSDKERLKAVLMYHVVPGKVMAADVKNGPAKTSQGANVALARSGTFVTVDDAVVTAADMSATNGVVHLVDRVLLPPR
jgi:uncharacterized surface protein with fasciclin (FAS1) repeats